MAKIKLFDVVAIKSTGPWMVVVHIDDVTGYVTTNWHGPDGKVNEHRFRPEVLVLIDPARVKAANPPLAKSAQAAPIQAPPHSHTH